MSVYKRAYLNKKTAKTTIKWQAHIDFRESNGKKIRVRKIFRTKRDADDFERRVRTELANGTYRHNVEEVPTFGDYAVEFMDVYPKSAKNKASEVASKQSILDHHLLADFGKIRIDKIRNRQIDKYAAFKEAAGYSSKTVDNHLILLRKMLNQAVVWEIMDFAPRIKRDRGELPDFDFLTFEEARQLLEALEEPWRRMVVVALNTGLRLGELIGLQWADINFSGPILRVARRNWHGDIDTPKSGKNRNIPLNTAVVEALEKQQHKLGPWVFCKTDGETLAAHLCKPPLQRACKKAGLRSVQWQVFRHTFASHLAMRGESMKCIQELMGHATLDMTMRYAHLSPGTRRSAVDALTETPPERHHSDTTNGEAVERKRRPRKKATKKKG